MLDFAGTLSCCLQQLASPPRLPCNTWHIFIFIYFLLMYIFTYVLTPCILPLKSTLLMNWDSIFFLYFYPQCLIQCLAHSEEFINTYWLYIPFFSSTKKQGHWNENQEDLGLSFSSVTFIWLCSNLFTSQNFCSFMFKISRGWGWCVCMEVDLKVLFSSNILSLLLHIISMDK